MSLAQRPRDDVSDVTPRPLPPPPEAGAPAPAPAAKPVEAPKK